MLFTINLAALKLKGASEKSEAPFLQFFKKASGKPGQIVCRRTSSKIYHFLEMLDAQQRSKLNTECITETIGALNGYKF